MLLFADLVYYRCYFLWLKFFSLFKLLTSKGIHEGVPAEQNKQLSKPHILRVVSRHRPHLSRRSELEPM